MKVLVTGLGQGNDPAGGIGVAVALRQQFRRLHIVGQDYTVRAAGLHHYIFDDVIIHRPWGEFDTAALKAQFADFLDGGGWVISTIDLEGYWLASHFAGHPWLLSPPVDVYTALAKPTVMAPAFQDLVFPASIDAGAPAADLHAFLRRHGWKAWLKGPFHDAFRVLNWESFGVVRRQLGRYWPFSAGHLQAHVHGTQEAVAFAAYQGRLLDAIWIVKSDVTAAGKTIGGSGLSMSAADRDALSEYVQRLNWTGGGEVELIRDAEGRPWLLEINSRFPAWVAGAALLGCNLPALLLEAAGGPAFERGPAHAGFVRVQQEVPTRAGYNLLPPLVLYPDEPLDGSKTAFNVHEIASHITSTIGLPLPDIARARAAHGLRPAGPLPNLRDVAALPSDQTPMVHRLDGQLRQRMADAASVAVATQMAGPALTLSYSVKTNPDPAVLAMAAAAGLWAEVISLAELRHALANGFARDHIIVNGPGKLPDLERVAALTNGPVFVDSLSELKRCVGLAVSGPIGMRLRPPGMGSRFGLALDRPSDIDCVLDVMRAAPSGRSLALHFHIPHAVVGSKVWRALAEAMVDTARMLMDMSGRPVSAVDVGGGFYPDDFAAELDWLAGAFRRYVVANLPSVETVFVEPGRALVQDGFAVQTSIRDVTFGHGRRELVVDASLGELPEAGHYPHRVCIWNDDGWRIIYRPGDDVILGRTCMEDDVLVRSLELADCRAGDRLLILDAGSYDRSMAYDFGRGWRH